MDLHMYQWIAIKSGSKIRYMFGGKLPSMVIRGQQGIGRGNGGSIPNAWSNSLYIPGMKVAMPSGPSDAAGLLRTATR